MRALAVGWLEHEPGPLFLPVQERLWLAYSALADVRLDAWDQRIVTWLAKSTDTSTLLTVLSLFERAKAAERTSEHNDEADHEDGSCPGCTCCTREAATAASTPSASTAPSLTGWSAPAPSRWTDP